ncbi:proton-coupled amino acid transporter-like protein CG1139 isoform X2 [Coccinella septempunctata]|uniref:proton-coupled amino acid transporter-like protein CG1139 isoform X2 n=1 Tax=Coccinella septempunctata TaxID=41139 RepID=UPI001D088A64|nr:proton-coupled amino acid transporter-like protein CG1139 isoform X2 [Coccinella septempunctata]
MLTIAYFSRTGLKKKPPSGYTLGVMNHLKCCIGSGIFTLGFAFKNAGMALGPPILVFLGIVALHCQHMLVAEHWGYTDLSIQMWVLIAFPPIVISSSTLGNLKLVGYLSLFANILTFLGIAITIYLLSVDLPEEFTFEWFGDMAQLPIFISIGILSFTAIQVVLPIYIESKYPEKVGSLFGVLNVAAFIEVTLTILIGVLSYMKYGKDCRGSITLNFKNGIAAQIVVICVGLAVMLSYTLNIYVVIEALFPVMSEKWGPFRHPNIGIFFFRLGCIIFTFILSWTLPMLGQIVALAGALGNTSLSVIFPALFHVILMWENSSVVVKIKDFLILSLGIFSLTAGTVAAIWDIVREIDKVYFPEAKNSTTG